MRDDEWDAWHAWAVTEYADDLVRNESLTRERGARAGRRGDRARSSPTGSPRPGIISSSRRSADTGRRVGYLWFGPRTRNPDPDVAWLYDIFVEGSERGRGIGQGDAGPVRGRGARRAVTVGSSSTSSATTPTARHLYDAVGYVEMARQMGKDLDN